MKTFINAKIKLAVLLCCFLSSCEDYLEIDVPDDKITSETVFNNDETANSAMVGILNQLASLPFSNGGPASVTVLAGLSADDLMPVYETNLPYYEFDQHEISPDNIQNNNIWAGVFNTIYIVNSLLEGLTNSQTLSMEMKNRLEGEAKFVRAFTYFYLVNLYGEVPLLLSTDYRVNAMAERNMRADVYDQIISDLQTSIHLLPLNFANGDRTSITAYTAKALLARTYLFLGNYTEAEKLSTEVIEENAQFELLDDLDGVFLANSREAIWQISPAGSGSSLTNTNEGGIFIIHPIFSFLAQLRLESSFVESFNAEDQRLEQWIEFHEGTGFFYPHKFKVKNSTEEIMEYSMVLRLAEQYLIRAEARAMQGNIAGAIADLDEIRSRAGLELIADISPNIGKNELLNLVIEERKKEFFTEWGHRWLDLKRTGKAGEVFGEQSTWEETDVFYPIPESERMKNPNLTQNEGY